MFKHRHTQLRFGFRKIGYFSVAAQPLWRKEHKVGVHTSYCSERNCTGESKRVIDKPTAGAIGANVSLWKYGKSLYSVGYYSNVLFGFYKIRDKWRGWWRVYKDCTPVGDECRRFLCDRKLYILIEILSHREGDISVIVRNDWTFEDCGRMCERNTVQRRGFIRDGVWRTNQKNRSVSRAWYDIYTGTREAQRRDARIRCDSTGCCRCVKTEGREFVKISAFVLYIRYDNEKYHCWCAMEKIWKIDLILAERGG